VYDYVDGKVDWMAYGLPVEGEDGPFVGQAVSEAVTVDVGATVAEARSRLREAGTDVAVVIHDRGGAVGEVDDGLLAGSDGDRSLLDVMRPVPSTIRPSVTVSSLAESGRERVLVSTSDGHLLGLAAMDPGDDDDHDHHDHEGHDHHDHEGHDHEGHDPSDEDDGSSRLQRMEQELTEVMEAVAVHFGEREPSDEELRSFLRERLLAEGHSAEEADQFMAEMDDQHGD